MNATPLGSDTRKKILASARKLFARHGFGGASIREIAKLSGVNLAAVNYHFKSKENLFWEVISESYQLADEFCRTYAEDSSSAEELAMKMFERFLKEKDLLRNSMKVMLTDDLLPEQESMEVVCAESLGPPGAQYFARLIEKDVPYKLSDDGLLWGVRALFGTITHWAMISQAHGVKLRLQKKLLTPEKIRDSVRNMIRSHMNYLRDHPEIFKA